MYSSNRMSIRLFFTWASTFFLYYFLFKANNIFLYLALSPIAATLPNALVVALHEFAHFPVYENKKIHTFIANFFVGWPVLLSYQDYRVFHLKHHFDKSNDVEKWYYIDKSWTFPKEKKNFILFFIKIYFDYATKKHYDKFVKLFALGRYTKHSSSYKASIYIYFTLIIASCWYFNILILLAYWLFNLVIWVSLYNRIRSLGQHYALVNVDKTEVQNIYPTFFEKFFISPLNSNLHKTHHENVQLPYYMLPKAVVEEKNYYTSFFLPIKGSVLNYLIK